MRTYLVNPPTPAGVLFMKEIGRCGRKSVAGECWPQTGMAYLAAVLREQGHPVELRDAMALGDTFDQALKHVAEFHPDLTVVHTVTPTYNSDLEFCSQLKGHLPDVPIAFVGTHAAALGVDAIRSRPVDLVIAEEGEIPLVELARAAQLDPKHRPLVALASEIPGWWTQTSPGHVESAGEGPLVTDLSLLPSPARDLLPNHRYRMPFFEGEPFATLIPSRGCPWNCTFCRSGITWGDNVRTRPVGHVLDEIGELQQHFHIRNLVFMTDTFTYHRDWVMELCAGIREHYPRLRWICNSRVDTVDPERLEAMAAAGCQMISFGVESADTGILKACKKDILPQQSRHAVRWTQQAGIQAFAYFILGLPGETWDTIRETVEFAIDLNPDYAFFHIATPFPGTELYRQAKEMGWLVSENWDLYEEDGGGVMRTEDLFPEDLRRAQKMALRRFYLRPSRLWRELSNLRSPRDLMAKIRAASHTFRR